MRCGSNVRAIVPYQAIVFFFFNDTATTEIYTLSLHDALPICCSRCCGSWRTSTGAGSARRCCRRCSTCRSGTCATCRCRGDRKSTRLNSSHANISYAVFCLKKKKETPETTYHPHSSCHHLHET